MRTKTTLIEKQTEPSMEDILSSIRGIISGDDDQDVKAPVFRVSPDEQKILDLIHMLNEDDTVETVLPYNSIPTSKNEFPEEKTADASLEEREEKTLEDFVAELAEHSSENEKADAFAGKLPPSEERALEEITRNLSEMDELQSSVGMSKEERLYGISQSMDQIITDIQEQVIYEPQEDDLLSDNALSEATDALDALNELADSATSQMPKESDGGKTVEALMKELLRPMLKNWLDANLPSMVRTIVNEQVEKVIQQKATGKPSGASHKAA